jgi:hypothetical protein
LVRTGPRRHITQRRRHGLSDRERVRNDRSVSFLFQVIDF